MAGDEKYCEDNKPGEEVAIYLFIFWSITKLVGWNLGPI